MKRRRLVLSAIAALLLIIGILAVVLSRQRLRRHRYFPAAPLERPSAAAGGQPSAVPQWSAQFRELETAGRWGDLAKLLDRISRTNPDLYGRYQLAYLHARALIEDDQPRAAMQKLAPFLANGNPFRELALFHQAEIDEARNEHEAASRDRQALIFGYPKSEYRDQALDDETEYLNGRGDVNAFSAFASRLYPSASTARRRDLEANLTELLLRRGDAANGLQKGLTLLRAGTSDDPADRVSRALDRPELIRRMTADQLALLGTAMFEHRHFDRAITLLSLAIRASPERSEGPASQGRSGSFRLAALGVRTHDQLQFAIGRSWFGDEKYSQAQQTYMAGANATRDAKWKATFLWHASRAAQLNGDDRTAERLMTAAIAVPGRFPATSAALTQRIRTRLEQKRFAEASADLTLLRKAFPRDHALFDGSLAYAIGMLGAGNSGAAIVNLNAVPPKMIDKFESAEIDYWRARALESANPQAAFAAYLNVLRSPMPTHFAYFARERLDSKAMAPKLARELAMRDAQVPALIQKRSFDLARRVQTDRILLSSSNHPAELKRLAEIYKEIPAYRAVLELKPHDFPRFPLVENPDRLSLLLAMGLFDEAADEIEDRYALRPMSSALTRSLALNRGNASRGSIYAVEVLMKSVPDDYDPELLPPVVRQLLYPRYFYDYIVEDSKHFGADPTLVLSIMREESRFNPRAKSEAAARGLLQFIITTARDIGRDIGLVNVTSEELYDPRVIIRLGAKYVSTLSKQFDNDHYATAAAYNAGAHQVALWVRLSPAPGDDFFLSSINFDETKHYVRKVMNSYRRYAEIYGNAGPQGGIRLEP